MPFDPSSPLTPRRTGPPAPPSAAAQTAAVTQAGLPPDTTPHDPGTGCTGFCCTPDPRAAIPPPAAQTASPTGLLDPAAGFAAAALTAFAIAAAVIWVLYWGVDAVRAPSSLARAAYLYNLAEVAATIVVLAVALAGVLGFLLGRRSGWLADAAQLGARIMLMAAIAVAVVMGSRDRGHVEAAAFAVLFAVAACLLVDLAACVTHPTGTSATGTLSGGTAARSGWRAQVGAVAVARVPSAHAIAVCLWCSAWVVGLPDLTWSWDGVGASVLVVAVSSAALTVKTLRSRAAGKTPGSRAIALLNLAGAAAVTGADTSGHTSHAGLAYTAAAIPALIRLAAPLRPASLDGYRLPSQRQPSAVVSNAGPSAAPASRSERDQ